MTTSFAVFMAFCVIGFDFMLYVLYQLQYGEKRARRAAEVAAARRRAGLNEPPAGNTNLPAPDAKARKPEIIPFLSPGESAAQLYFAQGLGQKHKVHGFSHARSGYGSLQARSRSAK